MDLPADIIPPSWLAFAHEWAPHVIAALVLTTILAHALLPLARRFEAWARTTKTTVDDEGARRLVAVLEWLAAASSALLAFLPRLAIGRVADRDIKPDNVSRITLPPTLTLATLLVLGAIASGCGASTSPTLIKARDLTCSGARVVCRVVDRACRASGGPAVLEEPDAEDEDAEETAGGEDSSGG